MSYALRNQNTGQVWHTNNSGWSYITNILEQHGWEGKGTVVDDLRDGKTWDGGYYSNDGQVVTREDANAMADACDRIPEGSLDPEWIAYFKKFAEFCRNGPFELW